MKELFPKTKETILREYVMEKYANCKIINLDPVTYLFIDVLLNDLNLLMLDEPKPKLLHYHDRGHAHYDTILEPSLCIDYENKESFSTYFKQNNSFEDAFIGFINIDGKIFMTSERELKLYTPDVFCFIDQFPIHFECKYYKKEDIGRLILHQISSKNFYLAHLFLKDEVNKEDVMGEKIRLLRDIMNPVDATEFLNDMCQHSPEVSLLKSWNSYTKDENIKYGIYESEIKLTSLPDCAMFLCTLMGRYYYLYELPMVFYYLFEEYFMKKNDALHIMNHVITITEKKLTERITRIENLKNSFGRIVNNL